MSFGHAAAPPPPIVTPVNTVGQDANTAAAAAQAAEEERLRLQKERGQAADILGGDKMSKATEPKPTLLSGIK